MVLFKSYKPPNKVKAMKKGDFVRIDFVGRLAATGEIFDLTSEEIAKKEGVYDEKQK
jgi:FKBP-type peptidyl-prolyl cis-trans isomerase 2